MKWSKIKIGIPIVTMLIMISVNAYANLIGTTSANFLKLGMGARPSAMGNAFLAQENDLNSIHWNPAGIFALNDRNAEYTHTEWFQGIRYESMRYVQPYTSRINLGGSIDFLYTGAINGWDVNQYGVPTVQNKFSAYDFSMNLSAAYKYKKNVVNGINLKLFTESIAGYSGYGFALDMGWLYYMSNGQWLKDITLPKWIAWSKLNYLYYVYPQKIGFVIKNVGTMSALDKETFFIPMTMGVGITKQYVLKKGEHKISYELDLNKPYYAALRANLGTEYIYNDMFFVRMGYKSYSNLGLLSHLSFGFGIYAAQWHNIKFDYSFSSFGDLGLTHQISLTMKIGNYDKALLAEKRKISPEQRRENKYNEYIDAAQKFEQEHNIKGAINKYLKAVGVKENKALYKKIASLYKQLGNEKKYKKYMGLAGEAIKPAKKEVPVPEAAKSKAEQSAALEKQAVAAAEAGKTDEAVSLLKKALQLNETAELHNKLGNIYLQNGEADKAAAEFDKAGKVAPVKKEVIPSTPAAASPKPYIDSAAKKEAAGDIQGAIDDLEKAFKIKPTADIAAKLGNLYLNIGNVEQATKYMGEADKLKAAPPKAETTPVSPAATTASPPAAAAEAEAKAKEAAAQTEKKYKDLYNQAKSSFDAGDYSNAINLINEALQIKDTAEGHELLGNIYINMGEVDKATKEFEKSSNKKEELKMQKKAVQPSTSTTNVPAVKRQIQAKSLIEQAHKAQNSGDLNKAISLVNDALKIEDSSEIHELLGNLYIQQGDATKAAEEFDKSTKAKEKKQSAASSKSAAAHKQQLDDLVKKSDDSLSSGDRKAAVDYLNKALAIEDKPSIHEKIGNIYLEMGNSDKAAIEFEKALK